MTLTLHNEILNRMKRTWELLRPSATPVRQSGRRIDHLVKQNLPPLMGRRDAAYDQATELLESDLFSRDENHAPLAAIGQGGLGRVAVLTAEADGEYTGRFASDPDAGTLLAALANWMRADDSAQDFLVTQEQERGMCRVGLSLDPARERDPWARRPELVTMLFRPGEEPVEQRGTFEWINPYKYQNPTITSITVRFRPNHFMFNNVDTTNVVTNTNDEERMSPPDYYTFGG